MKNSLRSVRKVIFLICKILGSHGGEAVGGCNAAGY